NIKAIVGLYRGNDTHYKKAISDYKSEIEGGLAKASEIYAQLLDTKELASESLALDLEPISFDVETLRKTRRHVLHEVREVQSKCKSLLADEGVRKDKGRRQEIQKFQKEVEELTQRFVEVADRVHYFEREFHWLTSRFPEPVYNDVPGLCKIASHDQIAASDYSLTAGRYVGVAKNSDEEVDFEERM